MSKFTVTYINIPFKEENVMTPLAADLCFRHRKSYQYTLATRSITLTVDKSHYKQFEKVFGIETLECDRPSLAVTREKEQEPSSLVQRYEV